MNISLEHKIIWISPERTGGEVIEDLFKKNSFFTCEKKNNYQLISLKDSQHSTSIDFYPKYDDFKIITTIRNPYDRVWSCYLKYYTKTFNPKDFESTKIKFNDYINKTFIETTNGVRLDSFYDKDSHFSKWTFNEIKPNYIIKFEDFNYGLKLLPISVEIGNTQSLLIQKYPNDNLIPFNMIYDYNSAKKIYQFYKNVFLLFDYSPYSFTKNELNDLEKIKFIHNYNKITN
jgi:hypothetical protein